MTIDAALTDLVATAIAPLAAELRAVRAELASVRATLPPRMLSISQAAEALGCSTQTVTAMLDRGELVGRHAGRRRLVDAASLRPRSDAEIVMLARAARGARPAVSDADVIAAARVADEVIG